MSISLICSSLFNQKHVVNRGLKSTMAGASDMYRCWTSIPVGWARLGFVSAFLAKQIRPLKPPILILSLPRCGSSWVGEILSNANNAIYLREPINQSFLASGQEHVTIFEVDPSNAPREYQQLGDIAFAGLPAFHAFIVQFPNKWGLFRRRDRRLVIKEVNPLAIEWFLLRYRPRLIFLVRHPAAVALSFIKRGWYAAPSETADWHDYGAEIGGILRLVLDKLKAYHDYRIVLYEDLCTNSLKCFRDLFNFAGLEWSSQIETLIQKKSSAGDRENPYETSRNSRSIVRAWKNQLTSEEMNCLKAGYGALGLPWYTLPDDW